jgi:hypothetical protein
MRKSFFIMICVLAIFLSSCTLLGNKKEEVQYPQEISQWAISATASDAYGGLLGGNRDDQSPFAATGEPDVEKCEDSKKAWVIGKDNDGLHWLELEYENEVYASSVKVKESFGPGAIAKIELLNGSDYITLWEGKDKNKACPGYFEANFEIKEGNFTKKMTPFMTNKVKVTLNTDVKEWNEIDAVQLIGYANRWYFYNNTLAIEENTE